MSSLLENQYKFSFCEKYITDSLSDKSLDKCNHSDQAWCRVGAH